jgi:hypothetical protein
MGRISASVKAQNIVDGRRLYTNPQVQSQTSCADSGCHGLDPAANLNRIKHGTDSRAPITAATQSVPTMVFLLDRCFVPSQLSNLATYIAAPHELLDFASISAAWITHLHSAIQTTHEDTLV